jgi:ribulose-phosphate 3-epimerase
MIIIPAILEHESDDALVLINKLRGTVDWIQIDFSDATMTKGETFDLFDLVGEVDDIDIEVHLMTTQPEDYLDACAAIGGRRVYFHLAEVESPSQILSAMDPYDFTKGIALSPQTPAEDVFPYIDEVDAVQIMTVMPGKQGSDFIPDVLDKIDILRERRQDLWISLDGGINEETIDEINDLSVDAVGVGSAIVGASDPVMQYHTLEELV